MRPARRRTWLVQLDDDALAGGNPGGVGDVAPDTANTTGTLAHVYGADGAGTTLLTAAGSVLPTGFTAVVSNGGQTLTISQGATAVLRIQLADTTSGAYTVTQLAAIDHPVAGTEDNFQFTVGYVATDGDGDTRPGRCRSTSTTTAPTVSANLAGAARRRCAGWQCRRRWRRRSRHRQHDRDAGAQLWRRRRRHDAADGGGQYAAGRLHRGGEQWRADADDQPGCDGGPPDPAHRHHLGRLHGHPAGCDRPPGGGDRGQSAVHGQLRGHRRRRRHGDRVAVDRRRRRHADGRCRGLAGRPGRSRR